MPSAGSTFEPGAAAGGGSGTVSSVISSNGGITVTGGSGPTVTLALGELDNGTLLGLPISGTATANYVLAINAGATSWTTIAQTGGVSYSVAGTFTALQKFDNGTIAFYNPGTTFTYNLIGSAITANQNLTLPLLTAADTVAVLGTAQTVTAVKSIKTGSASVMQLYNAAGTFYYTLSTAAIAANQTLNLPLITGTDTLAALGLAQSYTAVQTFGDNISFMGAALSGATTASGVLQYNGANWICTASAPVLYGVAGTFTALQKFDSSDLAIYNPGTTFFYTIAGAAIAASYTLTLPLISGADILAALNVAQTWTQTQTFQTIAAATDNTYSIGTAVTRFVNVNVSGAFQVFLNSGDAHPAGTLLSTGFLLLGAGGSLAPTTGIAYAGVNILGIDNGGGFNPIEFNTANNSGVFPNGSIIKYNARSTAGAGVVPIYWATAPTPVTNTEITLINTVSPPAVQGLWECVVQADIHTATAGTVNFTITYTNSEGDVQTNVEIPLWTLGSATPLLSVAVSGVTVIYGTVTFAINNASGPISVKYNGSGTALSGLASAVLRQLI